MAPLEAIIVRGRCAVVLYHLVLPKVAQVPIPFGFITEYPVKVEQIESFVNEEPGSRGTSPGLLAVRYR